ncbi:hypothetical protein NECAME_02196 [Necator americanus]|uniref:Uncharacterized protein n=1 Tax=Necator americanus TaxID=51031 RepID=W2THT4_NECAM|nr:hypothetical protein NECAME_02196 [Necator americanus]ETN81154.1 hypothetical protein NECAME_02196 [Necator americanus]
MTLPGPSQWGMMGGDPQRRAYKHQSVIHKVLQNPLLNAIDRSNAVGNAKYCVDTILPNL